MTQNTQQTPDDDVSGDLSSQFLKQSDFSSGESATFSIASVDKKTFEATNGRPAEAKWVVTFAGNPPRSLSLNKTNLALLAKWFGKRAGTWVGRRVEVYVDESIQFGGRLVGGLRVRRPAGKTERSIDPETQRFVDTLEPETH